MSKYLFAFLLVVVVGLVPTTAQTADAAPQDDDSIARLTEAVENGAVALHRYIQQTRPQTPLIYSQWYVDKLAAKDPARAAREQAIRDFGRKVAEALEKTSEKIQQMTAAEDFEKAALMLLDLGDWFASRPGYGNAFLANRCQDMATVPMAYLIVDLNYPLAKVEPMVARLTSFPDQLRFNAKALNTEAPAPIFQAGPGTTMDEIDRVYEPLEEAWNEHQRKILAWRRKPENKAFSEVEQVTGAELRAALPEELRFFCDDKHLSTTLNNWNRKHHELLLLGLDMRNIWDIQSFLIFRKKVGRFPTQPPAWWKPDNVAHDSAIEAAFKEAWRPFQSNESLHDAPAARVFEALQNRKFYDADTRRKRSD